MNFETTIQTGTIVSFPGGSLEGRGRVNIVVRHGDRWLVVVDRTPVHPLSLRWPDQPADHGEITFSDGLKAPITDAWTGRLNEETGVLLVGDDAQSSKRGDCDWSSVVVHVVTTERDLTAYAGSDVGILVDKVRRDALSRAHSAVHLAALALNAATERFWTKEYADLDSLGRPNLDKAAVERSSIDPYVSSDIYRLGKSLKKKGFDRDAFLAQLETVEADVNETVRTWLVAGGNMIVTPPETLLDDPREWQCVLDCKTATIPCGGTHAAGLADIGDVLVTLAPTENGFQMKTEVRPRE